MPTPVLSAIWYIKLECCEVQLFGWHDFVSLSVLMFLILNGMGSEKSTRYWGGGWILWSAKSKKIQIFSMGTYHYILFNLNCNYCTFLTANYILSNKYYTLPNVNYILLNKHYIFPSANYTLLNKYCSLFDKFTIVIPHMT